MLALARTSVLRTLRQRSLAAASVSAARSVQTEALMKEKGIVLPPYQPAVWSYVKCQRDGNTLHIGDHVGQDEDNVTVRGKVGEGDGLVSPEQATELSAQAALRMLSTLSDYLDGDLDRVEQVIKVTGFVNGVPDFIGHGKVVDGCSNMLVEVLGDRGKHARSCVGTGSLPAAVSMEMSVRVRD